MKTPITDAVNSERYVDHYEGYCAMLNNARRLELDREALMGACELWISERDNPSPCWVLKKQAEDKMRSALAAARANFPES